MLIPSPWPKNLALKILAAIWAAPTFLVGALVWVGIVFILNQGKTKTLARFGGVDVACNGWFAKWMLRNNWGAFTIGCFMFYWMPLDSLWEHQLEDRLLIHERVHVKQQLMLSIFQWVLYLIAWFAIFLRSGDPKVAYQQNPFERWARSESPGESP